MAIDAAGPDTVVSWKTRGYPGNRTPATDSMSLRTAASVPQTTPILRRQNRKGPPRAVQQPVGGQAAGGSRR